MLFNIKLKTKNGNSVKKKQVITVFFSLKFKKGLSTTAEFTYRILYADGKVHDPKRVFALKNQGKVNSMEDLTLKVLLNFCHIIANISKAEGIDPDFIMFISKDLNSRKNQSWKYMSDCFKRPKLDDQTSDLEKFLDAATFQYDHRWDKESCKKLGINKEELDLLKEFADTNKNCKFMNVDPMNDEKKYAKSIHICEALEQRINREIEFVEED